MLETALHDEADHARQCLPENHLLEMRVATTLQPLPQGSVTVGAKVRETRSLPAETQVANTDVAVAKRKPLARKFTQTREPT